MRARRVNSAVGMGRSLSGHVEPAVVACEVAAFNGFARAPFVVSANFSNVVG